MVVDQTDYRRRLFRSSCVKQFIKGTTVQETLPPAEVGGSKESVEELNDT